jgi:tetratricopeptide (TPR) repeat protein
MIEIAQIADALFSTTMTSPLQMDALSGDTLGRGIDAMLTKDYATAAREFRRAISLSPFSDNSLKATEYLANAYSAQGKTGDAIKVLRQGIKMFPTADNLNISLGNMLFSEGRYEEAAVEYTEAVRKNPTASQNYYSLGQAYLTLKQYGSAETNFKKAIRLSPRDSGGYYALGQTYRMTGRYSEAEQQLKKALSIKRDFPYVHYELGALYAEQKQLDKASEELRIVEEKAPEFLLDLQNKIYEYSDPRFLAAYSTDINLSQPPGTLLSAIDSSLSAPNARKSFTVNFVFDKNMDAAVVQNIANWEISRSTSYTTGGVYNWAMAIPSSEISVSSLPTSVYFDSENNTAKVTFTLTQNAAGDGTIDLSHLVFKFKGTDMHGNSMDPLADQYNSISLIG